MEKMKKSDHVSVDLNQLVESVKADLGILPSFSESCCIYKVPEQLLELNKNAYAPRIVSIGPIHHGKEKLVAMEEHKKMYLQQFLQRTLVPLEKFVECIMINETRLRNCYAETIDLSREDFVKMMLMDATFVIMIILKRRESIDQNQVDRIFFRPQKIWEVGYDLCLLENQLPFFILDELRKLSNIVNISMKKLTHGFLKAFWSPWVGEDLSEEINSSTVEHFVDFLGICQKPSKLPPATTKCKTLSAPSVNELRRAGVQFELRPRTKLLDIEFDKKKGTLKLPQLTLEDSTEILFRNLIAFEQCHGHYYYLGDYHYLMTRLVNSAKDVEILVETGIVVNLLSNNEAVSTLFHSLGKENALNPDNFLFAGLVKELDGYCKRSRNRWKANLKEKYFNTPWRAISVFAAALLLILTIIQSVCSIIQVRQK